MIVGVKLHCNSSLILKMVQSTVDLMGVLQATNTMSLCLTVNKHYAMVSHSEQTLCPGVSQTINTVMVFHSEQT